MHPLARVREDAGDGSQHRLAHARVGRRGEGGDEVADEGVDAGLEGHETAERGGGALSHRPVRVAEALDERRLELRHEGLERDAALVDHHRERAQDRGLDGAGVLVPEYADERTGNRDHVGFERRRRRGHHRLSQTLRGGLPHLRVFSHENALQVHLHDRRETFGQAERRDEQVLDAGAAVFASHLLPSRLHGAPDVSQIVRLVLLGHDAHDDAERRPRRGHHGLIVVDEQLEQALDELRNVVLLVEAGRLDGEYAAQLRGGAPDPRRLILQTPENFGEEEVVRLVGDGAKDRGGCARRRLRFVRVVAAHRGEERGEERLEVGRQRRAGNLRERPQRRRARGVDRWRRQLGEHGRQDLRLRPEHLLEALEGDVVGFQLG